MRFPLDDQDRMELRLFQLRSACEDCFFYCPSEKSCAHEWPCGPQENRLPTNKTGQIDAVEISLCKEFELA